MPIVDTHAHLDATQFAGDLDAVIERASRAGVARILSVGSDLASSEMAIELAHRYESVFAAVGVHPHEAHKFEAEAGAVRMLLGESKVVAVGEIGLDFSRGRDSSDEQRQAFEEQLRWARALNLPVSVHNRNADAETLEGIDRAGCLAVLHCFSGDWAFAQRALRGGHYVSFAGNVTFPRAEELRETAARIPEERLLAESDAPVLAPQSHRGRRNEPGFVGESVATLATVRHAEYDDLARSLESNAGRVFGWGDA